MKLENENQKGTTKNKKVKEVEREIPLDELIAKWKEEYGDIYKNTIDGIDIIWRPLKRKEYKELRKLKVYGESESDEKEDEIMAREEATCKMSVLYPNNIESLLESRALLASILSEEILSKSGFSLSQTESL